jgi:hypothetical protein
MKHNVTSDLWTYSDADWVYQVEDVVSGVLFFLLSFFISFFIWGGGGIWGGLGGGVLIGVF